MEAIDPGETVTACRYRDTADTSGLYPGIDAYGPAFDEASLRHHARRSNAEPIPRPLGLDVRFPAPGPRTAGRQAIDRYPVAETYAERLLREIEKLAPLFDRDRDVVQLRFLRSAGFLAAGQVQRLFDSLARHFHFSPRPDREFLFDPDGDALEPADIDILADTGFNRIVVTVPVPSRLPATRRARLLEPAFALLAACRGRGVRSVVLRLDFVFARYRPEAAAATVDALLAERPERVSLAGRYLDEAAADAAARLLEGGYLCIGPELYALPDDDLGLAMREERLGLTPAGYSAAGDCDLVGLGVGAVSRIGDGCCRNHPALERWEQAIDNEGLPLCCGLSLDADDRARADVIRQLLCRHRIDVAGIERRHGIDFAGHFPEAWTRLRQAREEGLLSECAGGYALASPHRDLLRIIALCFDRYSQQQVRAAHP